MLTYLLVVAYVMIYARTLFRDVYGNLYMHCTSARGKMHTGASKVRPPPLAALRVLAVRPERRGRESAAALTLRAGFAPT